MIKKYVGLLLLCFVVCITLCSCGSNKEELFANAVDLPFEEIQKDLEKEDVSIVEKKYTKDCYKLCSKVISVSTSKNSIYLRVDEYNCEINVYLSKKDMENMQEGLYVNLAGKIDSIVKYDDSFAINFSKSVYIDNVVEVEGFIANISDKNFLILENERTLIGKASFIFYQENGEIYTNSFSDELNVERFENENGDLNYFTVNEEPFFNGDTVVVECVKVNDEIREILKIECTGSNGEFSARKYINDLYNEGEQYTNAGKHDHAYASYRRLYNYKDAQSKANGALNMVLNANKDTDLSKMQGMWHSIEDCYSEKGICRFISIDGTLVRYRAHLDEPRFEEWYIPEFKDNKLESEWTTTREEFDQVVSERNSKEIIYFEDGNIIKLDQYDDGETVKTIYYKTSREVVSKYSDSSSSSGSSGKKCAKSGCSSKAVTTGDSIYCAKHSNRCLNCSCYIDGDAMYCMSCIRQALQ